MTLLDGGDVPQADRLEAVADWVRRQALGLAPPEGVSARHRAYRNHAARVLGWVQKKGGVTEVGEVVARALAGPEVLAFAMASFERSRVATLWLSSRRVDDVLQLDPEDAYEFLRGHSSLSESTARRRASTLASWIGAIRTLGDNPPPSLDRIRRYLDGRDLPPSAARLLGEPVDVRVPTRMANWANRAGVETFGELLRREPADLLAERNLGRRSIRQTDEVLRQLTGLGWSRIRELMLAAEGSDTPAGTGPEESSSPPPDSWNALRERCPPALLDLPLERIALPSRMLTFVCEPHGVDTLGTLVDWREADLASVPKLGPRSIRDATKIIRELLDSYEESSLHGGIAVAAGSESSSPLDLDQVPELFAHLKGRIARLDPLERLVLSRRAGLHGETLTLEELGETIGVSRERVRQLERQAVDRLAREWWVPLVLDRLEGVVGDDAVLLDDLGERDAFFSDVAEHPISFDYVLARILRSGYRVVAIGDQQVLARAEPKEVRAAVESMKRAARRLDFPVPWEVAIGLAAENGSQLAPALLPFFQRELEALLAITEDGEGRRVAAGYGWGIEARVLSHLEAADRPMTREELERAIGGRFRVPDKVIYVARGVLALPKHVPDFDLWSRRLVPLCVNVMEEEGPDRQWSASELLDAVGERAQLPDWLGHWHLASMLRLSGQVRYLGRLQVALDHHDAPDERKRLRDVLVATLERAGGPLTFERLEREVQRVRAAPTSLRMTLLQPPFFAVDQDRFGLVPRDVPGGSEGLAEAVTALEAELERGQQGIGPGEALDRLRDLSDDHARWTIDMVKSLARLHDSLRLNRSGAIGLAEWEDERLPTRRDMIGALVVEAGGRLSVAAAQDQIESAFGTRPTRVQLSNLIHPLAIHLRGDYLISSDLLLRESPAPDAFPDLGEIADFPRAAVPIFRRLLQEPPRDLLVLRREAREYVMRFERAHIETPHVEPEEARAVASAIEELIDSLADDATEMERLMVQAAARYFLLSEDAESDFAVGGLDDDIAVMNAVAAYLGRPECVVRVPVLEHRPQWYARLPDEGTRRVFEHLFEHGVVTEPEAAFMLGGHRALRRFARQFETLVESVPFHVRIDVVAGVKRYVREERYA